MAVTKSVSVRVLMETRTLLANPAHWCQGHLGLTADGRDTCGHEAGTMRRCLIGAVNAASKVVGANRRSSWVLLTKHIPRGEKSRGIAMFNNTHSHKDVLALIDRAIAGAR